MLLARIYESQAQGGACRARRGCKSSRCGAPPLWGADATDRLGHRQRIITRILAYLGEPTQAPPIAPAARSPPPLGRVLRSREGIGLSEPLSEYEFDQRVSG